MHPRGLRPSGRHDLGVGSKREDGAVPRARVAQYALVELRIGRPVEHVVAAADCRRRALLRLERGVGPGISSEVSARWNACGPSLSRSRKQRSTSLRYFFPANAGTLRLWSAMVSRLAEWREGSAPRTCENGLSLRAERPTASTLGGSGRHWEAQTASRPRAQAPSRATPLFRQAAPNSRRRQDRESSQLPGRAHGGQRGEAVRRAGPTWSPCMAKTSGSAPRARARSP